MTKIAFVLPPGALPVPERKGGAIETLMTMLLEQNETSGTFQMIFISPDTKDSLVVQKYAKCYTCSPSAESLPFDELRPTEQPYVDLLAQYPYDYKANLIVKHEKPDYVIMEGDALRIRNCFAETVSKERLAMHLHGHSIRRGICTEAFGVTIAPSRFVAREWNKDAPENVQNTYLLQNSIRTEVFSAVLAEDRRLILRQQLGFAKEDFVVLYCGRLIEVKGVAELISAILSIPEDTVKLLLIGSDSFADGNREAYAETILKIVDAHKDRVCYLGYIDNCRLSEFYQCADMMAVPSLCEEAVGLVALEGMCSGLPLILTNSGGMVEYVPDNAGRKIARGPNLIECLAERILWMRSHPAERAEMGRLGRVTAQKYSPERYYKSFCEMMCWWERLGAFAEKR